MTIYIVYKAETNKQYNHTSNEYSHPTPGGLISHFYLFEIQS